MNALAVALELPGVILGPLVCRVRGHRCHIWTFHAASPRRICVRCGRDV